MRAALPQAWIRQRRSWRSESEAKHLSVLCVTVGDADRMGIQLPDEAWLPTGKVQYLRT